MALVECKACGKQISENAKECPHCGEPLSKKLEQSITWPLIIIGTLLVFSIGSIINITSHGYKSPTSYHTATITEPKNSKWVDMIEYALIKNKSYDAVRCKQKYIKGKDYILCDYYVGGTSGHHKKALFSLTGNKVLAINGTAKQKALLKYDEISAYDPAKDGVISVSDILGHFN